MQVMDHGKIIMCQCAVPIEGALQLTENNNLMLY